MHENRVNNHQKIARYEEEQWWFLYASTEINAGASMTLWICQSALWLTEDSLTRHAG